MRLRLPTASDGLILLVALHVVVNIIWVKFNNAPPAWDQADHTFRTLQFSHFFTDLFGGQFNLGELISAFTSPYGPLVKMMDGLILAIFQPDIKLAQMMGTVFFVGAITGVYFLTKKLYENEGIAFLSALIFSFYQLIYDNSRWLLVDIPMLCFIIFAWYFLLRLKDEIGSNRRVLVGLTVVSAAAILTKVQALIYLLPMYIYVGIYFLRTKKIGGFRSLLGSALTSGAVTLLWIVPSIENIRAYFFNASTAEVGDLVNLADPATWFFYLKIFINHQITFMGFAFFVVALCVYIFSNTKHKFLVFGHIAYIYVLFTLFNNKDPRFVFPLLPWTAIVMAVGIGKLYLKWRSLAVGMIIAYVGMVIVLFFNLSFGGPLKQLPSPYIVIPHFGDLTIFNVSEFPVHQLDQHYWPNEQMIKDLGQIAAGDPLMLLFLPNFDGLNDNNTRMYLAQQRLGNIQLVRAGGRLRFDSQSQADAYGSGFEYVLYTDSEIGVSYQIDREAFVQLQRYVKGEIEQGRTERLKEYKLPTGQVMQILRLLK